jgi:hypothetical protein
MNFPTTSKTLLEKIKSGDEIYWEEFYHRYSGLASLTARLRLLFLRIK